MDITFLVKIDLKESLGGCILEGEFWLIFWWWFYDEWLYIFLYFVCIIF